MGGDAVVLEVCRCFSLGQLQADWPSQLRLQATPGIGARHPLRPVPQLLLYGDVPLHHSFIVQAADFISATTAFRRVGTDLPLSSIALIVFFLPAEAVDPMFSFVSFFAFGATFEALILCGGGGN